MCRVTSITERRSGHAVAVDTTETTALAVSMLKRSGLGTLEAQLRIEQSELFDPNVCTACGSGEPWYRVEDERDAPLVLASDDNLDFEQWSLVRERWLATPVQVAVFGFESLCDGCSAERTWVTGLRPWPNYLAGDFVQADQPSVVRVLRHGLQKAGNSALVAQLMDRPPGLRGASYNANSCPSCGALDEWHTFERIMIEFWHGRQLQLAHGAITRGEWTTLVAERQGVWCE